LGGADFAELAKTSSQELASQSLAGDMGFVKISELLPELSEAVDSMTIGQVKLMASRYGLHLVKLVAKNNNGPQGASQVHLNQIFIKTNDFQQWLNNETKNLNVKILINPALSTDH
jgi:parvulin-like peptidyl-prolyl isomerase